MEKAYLLRISGRVTGIGFRYLAARRAAACPGLKGHVRNLGPGEVEVLAQGDAAEVDAFISWLRAMPYPARIDEFKLCELPLDAKLDSFDIV